MCVSNITQVHGIGWGNELEKNLDSIIFNYLCVIFFVYKQSLEGYTSNEGLCSFLRREGIVTFTWCFWSGLSAELSLCNEGNSVLEVTVL